MSIGWSTVNPIDVEKPHRLVYFVSNGRLELNAIRPESYGASNTMNMVSWFVDAGTMVVTSRNGSSQSQLFALK
jgi:hypothetical protein